MQRLILIIFRNEFKIITSIFLMFCWFLVCPRFLWTRRREWKTTMLSCGYFLKKFLLISRWVIWIHTFYWLSSSISSIPCSWTTPTPIWLICSSMTLFFLLYFNTMKYFFVKIDHFFLDSYETTIGSLFWWLWRTISVLPSDLQIEARNLVLWSLQEESALSTSWLVWWLFSILIAFRCDRVLYYASSSAKCHIHSTTSCPTVFVSDHLPVVSHSTITLSSSPSLPSLSSPSLLDVFDSLFLSFP